MSFQADTHGRPLSTHEHEAELIVEQLRQEKAELQHALEMRTQEHVLLNEVISTVGSTLRLDEVLHHIVDIVVRATQCQKAFIYLYDREKELLTLAATTPQHKRFVGKIELPPGVGIAGWVALHREPVFLKEQAMNDPRFRYFPELEEEKFQSILTVPVISATSEGHNLIGVITVQAIAPHEFTEEHQRFIGNTAALVASAIANAQAYENSQRKLRVLTSLSILSQTMSAGLYLDDMLRSLATLTLQIMEVDLCVIMLMDSSRRLVVRATSPNLNDHAHLHTIDVDRNVLERLQQLREGGVAGEDALRSNVSYHKSGPLVETTPPDPLDPVRDTSYKTLLSAPLISGTEQLGLLNCYSNRVRRYTAEDQTLLTTIANQAAIAVKNSQLVNQLAQKNVVKGFFDDLFYGTSESEESLRQRASFLGCDLTRAHTVVLIKYAPVEHSANGVSELATKRGGSDDSDEAPDTSFSLVSKRISTQFRRRLQDQYPGSLLYERDNLLTCLVSLTKDPTGGRLKTWLAEQARQTQGEHHVQLAIGISNVCQSMSDYRRGFAEASEALQMGQHLSTQPANDHAIVTHFNDLGVYRYLYKIAHMDDLRDVYQDQVARIDSYDRRKNTDLLVTLETYLECAGNLTKTAERLYVHRNTLIQRLDRLQSLCDIDLQERANWLTLQVAIKIYKLRAGEI